MRNNASRCPRRPRRQPAPVAVGIIAVGVVVAWGVGLAQDRGADPAERLWLDAQRFEQEGELEAALEQYALIVEQFPQSVQAPRALLGLGLGRWSQGDAPRALNATGQLRQSYAESREAAAGLVLEGDIERLQAVDQAALREARATYGRVVAIYPPARYPALAARVHALVRSGEISLLLDDVDEAAAAFLAVVEDEPPAAESGFAQLGLAHVLLEQGDWASAAETLQASLSSDVDTVTGTETERRMARNRLNLIHRMVLRPQTGQSPWSAARMLTVQGVELNDPIGVAASSDGRLVIADEDGPMASVIDRNGEAVERRRIDDIRRPWFDTAGTAYFLGSRHTSAPDRREEYQFSVPSNDVTEPLENLAAGVRGLFGQWYLLDTDPRRVLRFDAAGAYDTTLVEPRPEPVDLAVDGSGRLYVLQEESNTVVRFDSDGTREGAVVTGEWRRPYAIDVDALGNLYVLDRDENTVQVYDPMGRPMLALGPSLPGGIALDDPRDVAVDDAGRVFIADRGAHSIVVLE